MDKDIRYFIEVFLDLFDKYNCKIGDEDLISSVRSYRCDYAGLYLAWRSFEWPSDYFYDFHNEYASFESAYIKHVKDSFNSCEKLYHFTTFESACKILSTGFLRFSRLSNMNDLTESHKYILPKFKTTTFPNIAPDLARYIPIITEATEEDASVTNSAKRISNAICQISLSKDFDILPMWGHYAKNGRGVCIVFDKVKLLNSFLYGIKEKPTETKKIILFDDVKYSLKALQEIKSEEVVSAHANNKKFEKFCRKYYLRKTKDWKYEQEYRILGENLESDDMFLPFLASDVNCVNSLIMFNWDVNKPSICNTAEYQALQRIAGFEIPIYEYQLANVSKDNPFSCNQNSLCLPTYSEIPLCRVFPREDDALDNIDFSE